MSFRDDVYEAVRSRLETARLAGMAPDDHMPVSLMTDYVLGCLGNDKVRKLFEEYRDVHK